MARPPTDPVLVAEGLALIAGGVTPEEAAEVLRAAGKSVSSRTLRRALPVAPVSAQVPPPIPAAPPHPGSRTPPPASVDLGIEPDADMLTAARHLLAAVTARAGSADPIRFASLIEKASSLIGRVEQIEARRPKPVAPDALLEELRRLDADAIRKIEAHLPDPVDPSEVRAA